VLENSVVPPALETFVPLPGAGSAGLLAVARYCGLGLGSLFHRYFDDSGLTHATSAHEPYPIQYATFSAAEAVVHKNYDIGTSGTRALLACESNLKLPAIVEAFPQ
jgi:hypothetical protein